MAQLVKNPPAMWETWVWSLGWEDPLEKGKATHSSILAWRIPWTIQSMGLQRVGHDWATNTTSYIYMKFYGFKSTPYQFIWTSRGPGRKAFLILYRWNHRLKVVRWFIQSHRGSQWKWVKAWSSTQYTTACGHYREYWYWTLLFIKGKKMRKR